MGTYAHREADGEPITGIPHSVHEPRFDRHDLDEEPASRQAMLKESLAGDPIAVEQIYALKPMRFNPAAPANDR